mmetsp:Transcript_53824/g.169344  ORF Transcript_53824/g.169344 Transcript_53824/m.169344 type:complete len:607 (+) Transcript_53824:83-1903(+)
MFEDTHDTVAFIIGCTILTAHVAKLVKAAIGACLADPSSLRLDALCSSISSHLSPAWASAQLEWDNDPHTAEVERLVTERRLKLARMMYKVGTWCFMIIEVFVLLNIATGTPRFLTNGLDVVVHAVFLLLTVTKVEPRLVQTRTLDVWYSVFMLAMAAAATPLLVFKEALPSLSSSMMSLRLLAGLTSLNMPLVVFWNSVYLLTASISYHAGNSDCSWMPYTSTFAVAELVGFINSNMILYAMKTAARALIRREIEAKSARRETSAVIALLSTMGDAVVELDKDLRIVGKSTQLSTMLLQGPRHSLAGMPFESLLASEDDVRLFKEYMAKDCAANQTLADVFHVKVRDTLNNSVRVEIFHVFKMGEGQDDHDHLLGIREDTEFERMDGMKVTGDVADPDLAAQAPAMTTTDACLTKVTFDPSSMEVLEYSADFVALLGQRPMHNVFETWVAENSRRGFMEHFRHRVAQWRASSVAVVRVSYRNMSLKIPLSANTVFRFSSTCTMVLTMKIDPEEYAGEGRPVAEAIFTDIKPRGASTPRRSRRPRGPGTSDRDSDSGSTAGGDRPTPASGTNGQAVLGSSSSADQCAVTIGKASQDTCIERCVVSL